MTSPIGSGTLSQSSSLEPLANNRNTRTGGTQTSSGSTPAQPETVRPTMPSGPLGNHINTTA
ncbi:hypothetical protein [Paraburkholderia sp. J67]|uniref:hypothetical protein n=1 Tax=Paraburkholderia sp. J67 TaxID=2805435 RepID=UPI002ABD3C2E|nr:hypothetical protein [Paraburkholderia sp. J67]